MNEPIRAWVICFVLGVTVLAQEAATDPDNISYENRNQIDYGPLRVSRIRGLVQDADGVPIPKARVGIFTDADHKLIAVTQSDEGGRFELKGIPKGDYRMLANSGGFCPANATLRITSRWGTRKSLTVEMRVAGIDTCSYIELK